MQENEPSPNMFLYAAKIQDFIDSEKMDIKTANEAMLWLFKTHMQYLKKMSKSLGKE